MFIIEEENAISKHHLKIIQEKILGVNFPWYYQLSSTTDKFPFLSHTLMPRYDEFDGSDGKINSEYHGLFLDIFNSFCIRHNLKVKKVLRAALNLSVVPYKKFPYTDPHVDHAIEHYNMLMYLNDCPHATTIVFEEASDGKVVEHPLENVNTSLTIGKEIDPKQGKIVVFSGMHFHAHRFVNESERRVVCVMTFTV